MKERMQNKNAFTPLAEDMDRGRKTNHQEGVSKFWHLDTWGLQKCLDWTSEFT